MSSHAHAQYNTKKSIVNIESFPVSSVQKAFDCSGRHLTKKDSEMIFAMFSVLDIDHVTQVLMNTFSRSYSRQNYHSRPVVLPHSQEQPMDPPGVQVWHRHT